MGRLVTPKTPSPGVFSKAGNAKDYAERVAKYVPSEIIAGYITINGFIVNAPPATQKYLTIGNFFLCWILTPIYLHNMAEPGQPKKMHLIISTIAFVIWAYAVGGTSGIFGTPFLNWYNPALASIVLVVFTLVSGAFVPSAPPSTTPPEPLQASQ